MTLPQPVGLPTELETVGDHILSERIKRRLSQSEVADIVGLKCAETILRWEKNQAEPCIAEWPGIILFLGYYPYPTETFGEVVLEYRRRQGMSLRTLGEKAGIDPSTASRVEQNRMGVAKKSVENLKDLIGIDTDL